MAAGLELEKMADVIQNDQVGLIRIMPNTPVAIGQRCYQSGPLPSSDRPASSQSQPALIRSRALYEIEEKIDGSCNGCRRPVGQPLSIR